MLRADHNNQGGKTTQVPVGGCSQLQALHEHSAAPWLPQSPRHSPQCACTMQVRSAQDQTVSLYSLITESYLTSGQILI